MNKPFLELKDISKSFGRKKANDGVCLKVPPGEVHALVGENGAGKTTLMTMVAGTALPDSGSILIDGEEVTISTPGKASELGIGMVHQHFKLVPSLTVADNVFLGHELRTKHGTLDKKRMEKAVAERAERVGMQIDPTRKIEDLSVGEKQRVEVLKALGRQTRLLILDEPTAVLTPAECDELFEVMRGLAADGCAVLFISHKLGEVLTVADQITVLRDGRTVGTVPAQGLSQADIARMMVGREVLLRIDHPEGHPGDEVLRVEDLSIADPRGLVAVRDLSMTVRAGEVLGVAGVEGNGQSELATAIAGLELADRGKIVLSGRDITSDPVAKRRALGMSYVPEDRHAVGTAPSLSVVDNVIATHLKPPIVSSGVINDSSARNFAAELIDEYDVRGAAPSTEISTLSGGNMQKVVIAREFSSNPSFLMVSQPTRGVDVGAMEFVHNTIIRQRDAGSAVLVFSADLNEIMSLSDRMVVMYRGSIVAEFSRDRFDEVAIGMAMAGVTASASENSIASPQNPPDLSPVKDSSIGIGNVPYKDLLVEESAQEKAGAVAIERRQSQVAEAKRGTWMKRALKSVAQPVGAIAFSLLIGAIIILALGKNPLAAYNQLFLSSFQTPHGISGLVSQFIPLVLLSASVIVSFKAGFFNIGGEGQLFIGAFCGAFAGFTFVDLPGPLLAILILGFGALGGGLWGAFPGWLYAKWRVDIIVSTLMLSTIATLLTAYLVAGPFQDPSAGMASSPKIAPQSRLPMFDAQYGLGMDLVIALIVTAAIALIATKSTWGLKLREVGELNQFAPYVGVNERRMSVQVMIVAGAVAGVAGALFVLGPSGGRFLQSFSPGYGFLGITVALLARLNPWAAIIAALFYADMMSGSNAMQVNASVPYPLVNVLQGLIILTITASVVVDGTMRRKLRSMLPKRHKPDKADIPPAFESAVKKVDG